MTNSPEHILTFISECYRFIDRNGITSMLKVDKDNSIEDLRPEIFDDVCNEPAGIIAEMQNVCGELINKLYGYYKSTNNKAAIKRLDKLVEKYDAPKRK